MNFLDMALALQLAVAFGGGLLAFISPCVLPLLPGYLAMVSGYSVADLQKGEASTAKMLQATLLFVVGFTIIFVAQGAGATSISGFLLQNQVVVTRIAGAVIAVFGVVMVGMSFSTRGIFAFFARERRFHVVSTRFGFLSPGSVGGRIRVRLVALHRHHSGRSARHRRFPGHRFGGDVPPVRLLAGHRCSLRTVGHRALQSIQRPGGGQKDQSTTDRRGGGADGWLWRVDDVQRAQLAVKSRLQPFRGAASAQ